MARLGMPTEIKGKGASRPEGDEKACERHFRPRQLWSLRWGQCW